MGGGGGKEPPKGGTPGGGGGAIAIGCISEVVVAGIPQKFVGDWNEKNPGAKKGVQQK